MEPAKELPENHTELEPPLTFKKYSTFEGVFNPTLLTILGVIMYLRTGWVVGNAGLLGGILVVLMAVSITLATGLSLSSIATNTRIGAGGPYAMIAKALGIEIGGSIGLPLFLSQVLAIAMYVFGFREGWLTIFPNHSAIGVDIVIFSIVLLIAYISAGLAFRLQYIVLAFITISLFSIFGTVLFWRGFPTVSIWGNFPGTVESNLSGTTFWEVFAVFFPAVTGIMSGVNMSGELHNSRQSIPRGTIGAIGVSTLIYLLLVIWLAFAASPVELVSNYTILVEKSLWPPLVVVGLLSATFSSALSSCVGAPRILMALANDRILPQSQWLAKLSRNGEPRRALLVSGVITFAALMMRDLNVIAPLITMFFLITYGMINVVVLLESSLGLMNFRPTLRLPIFVPFFGAVGCLFAMLVINAGFSLGAIAIVLILYLRLVGQSRQRRATTDVRSGIFSAIAEWAATKVMELDLTSTRAWKPTLLVPIDSSAQILGEFRLLVDLCYPEGAITLLGFSPDNQRPSLTQNMQDLTYSFRKHHIFTNASVMTTAKKYDGIISALQTLQSSFFSPNVLFLQTPQKAEDWPMILNVFQESRALGVGVMLLGLHPFAGLGREEVINFWLRPQFEVCSFAEKLKRGSSNLSLLMALRLHRSWRKELNLIAIVASPEEVDAAEQFMHELRDLCRIPSQAKTVILVGRFPDCIHQLPQGDINFIGLQSEPKYEFTQKMLALTGSSCFFMRDSGKESALA